MSVPLFGLQSEPRPFKQKLWGETGKSKVKEKEIGFASKVLPPVYRPYSFGQQNLTFVINYTSAASTIPEGDVRTDQAGKQIYGHDGGSSRILCFPLIAL